jgi:hypothetical protein
MGLRNMLTLHFPFTAILFACASNVYALLMENSLFTVRFPFSSVNLIIFTLNSAV